MAVQSTLNARALLKVERLMDESEDPREYATTKAFSDTTTDDEQPLRGHLAKRVCLEL